METLRERRARLSRPCRPTRWRRRATMVETRALASRSCARAAQIELTLGARAAGAARLLAGSVAAEGFEPAGVVVSPTDDDGLQQQGLPRRRPARAPQACRCSANSRPTSRPGRLGLFGPGEAAQHRLPHGGNLERHSTASPRMTNARPPDCWIMSDPSSDWFINRARPSTASVADAVRAAAVLDAPPCCCCTASRRRTRCAPASPSASRRTSFTRAARPARLRRFRQNRAANRAHANFSKRAMAGDLAALMRADSTTSATQCRGDTGAPCRRRTGSSILAGLR